MCAARCTRLFGEQIPDEKGAPLLLQSQPLPKSWGTSLAELIKHFRQNKEDLPVTLETPVSCPNYGAELVEKAVAEVQSGSATQVGQGPAELLYDLMCAAPEQYFLSDG